MVFAFLTKMVSDTTCVTHEVLFRGMCSLWFCRVLQLSHLVLEIMGNQFKGNCHRQCAPENLDSMQLVVSEELGHELF